MWLFEVFNPTLAFVSKDKDEASKPPLAILPPIVRYAKTNIKTQTVMNINP